MKLNRAMELLLEKYEIHDIHLIPPDNTYPVWQKEDAVGRKYWGVSSFWGIEAIAADQDLSQLEWDGNEVYLDAQRDEEVTAILQKAVGILRCWKSSLESQYPDTLFYLFASYDDGDMQILEEGDLTTHSVTLRFWADRGTDTVISFESFADWTQPAMVGHCNF